MPVAVKLSCYVYAAAMSSESYKHTYTIHVLAAALERVEY